VSIGLTSSVRLQVNLSSTLAFTAARQLEIAREYLTGIEPLAFPRIGERPTVALAELATTVARDSSIDRGSKSINTSVGKSSCENVQ
jgi:hypothetical protein